MMKYYRLEPGTHQMKVLLRALVWSIAQCVIVRPFQVPIPFSEEVRYWDKTEKRHFTVGTLTGKILFLNGPMYAQMVGGLNTESGTLASSHRTASRYLPLCGAM